MCSDLDAFILNQGVVALCLILVTMFVFLPRTLWARHTDRRLYDQPLAKAGIYLLTAVAVFACNPLQNRMADRRAIKIGNACLAFHAKCQHYPGRLDELVPHFLPSVPVAKYTLGGNDFFYFSPPEGREPCCTMKPSHHLVGASSIWKQEVGGTSTEAAAHSASCSTPSAGTPSTSPSR